MNLEKIKSSFKNGELKKPEYIDEMYKYHSLLFDYSKFITYTNISSIEIRDRKVIMTFRDSGVRFICIKNDKRLAPIDTLNFDSYETEELQMQLNLMDEGINIFDIGGNAGWYALHVAKAKPNSTVYSFEPVPTTFTYLNENISINKLLNIKTFNFGFSDKEGEFSFFYDSDLSVNASLLNVSGNKNIQEVKCFVKTLDNFHEKEKVRIDFIKCDIEGAELLAFKGGIKTIKQNSPIIFTEMLRKWAGKFNYHPNDIINLLKGLGYSCFIIRNDRLVEFNLVDETTAETNYLFLHNDRHKDKISKYLIN